LAANEKVTTWFSRNSSWQGQSGRTNAIGPGF